MLLPNEGGLRGLRIGTYLHGPLLAAQPARRGCPHRGRARPRDARRGAWLPLDDRLEWAAHDAALARLRRTASRDRRDPGLGAPGVGPGQGAHRLLTGRLRLAVDPVMAKREAARLGEERQPVRPAADTDDLDDATGMSVDDRDPPAKPVGDP